MLFGNHLYREIHQRARQADIDNRVIQRVLREVSSQQVAEFYQAHRRLPAYVFKRVAKILTAAGVTTITTSSLLNSRGGEHKRLRADRSEHSTPDRPPSQRIKTVEISPQGEMRRTPNDVRTTLNFGDNDVPMVEDGEGSGSGGNEVARTAMAGSSQASGRTGHHGETPISNPLMIEPTPWRPTTTALHNYYAFPGATTITPTQAAIWTYRLNSVYDCRVNTHTDVEPGLPPVADAADATPNEPPFRTHYKNLYNYWTVISSKYRIRVQIVPTTEASTTKDVEYMCYVYHHGSQRPPQYAEATGAGSTLITHQMRRTHPGMYYFPIRYNADQSRTRAYDLAENSAEGEWYPGSIKHEVAEDELKQVWHRQSEVPPTMEGLTIIVQRSPSSTSGVSVDVRCEITIDYVTQYKDLKRDFQYPSQLTDDPSGSDIGAQTN